MVFFDANRRLYPVILLLIITIGFSFSGCSSLSKKDDKATAPVSSTSTAVPALYYDFGDVLVPKELKVNKKSSFIYQTGGFSAGVLVLKARIDTSSLISFFERNMVKDNWKIISSFKSEQTLMLFQKAQRWCVITIADGSYNTNVKIWVAPTL